MVGGRTRHPPCARFAIAVPSPPTAKPPSLPAPADPSPFPPTPRARACLVVVKLFEGGLHGHLATAGRLVGLGVRGRVHVGAGRGADQAVVLVQLKAHLRVDQRPGRIKTRARIAGLWSCTRPCKERLPWSACRPGPCAPGSREPWLRTICTLQGHCSDARCGPVYPSCPTRRSPFPANPTHWRFASLLTGKRAPACGGCGRRRAEEARRKAQGWSSRNR